MHRLDGADETNGNEIAVIGMAGRFPGAKDIEAFWQNLCAGVESISFFSQEELLEAGVDRQLLQNPEYVRARGMLDDIAMFDASFFRMSPLEATITDPQQRLFLECAWQALEHAGYNSDTYQGLIGVYGGLSSNMYMFTNLYGSQYIREEVDQLRLSIGNEKDYLATHVSYKLNLCGPAMTVQSACSTSLVAVHLASQSLLAGECDIALAGGVSIRGIRNAGYRYHQGGINSPDGHCRAFDSEANGSVSGDGLGIVVLKRLADALNDRDTIHALIKGSAINNDGSRKVAYTAPSVHGQAEVISEALAMAGIEPETVRYIEAHGSATLLGDAIEFAALSQSFAVGNARKRPCALGSVKTNIGHLDAASGIAGLIKTILVLKHQALAPSLHFEAPNPQIDLAASSFYVNTALTAWEADEYPRRAAVNSFGIGGTNAHMLLEEAPQKVKNAPGSVRPWQILPLSAQTASALETASGNLMEYLKNNPEQALADIAYTLQVGRKPFRYRRAIICPSRQDALSSLETMNPTRVFTAYQEDIERPLVFLFPAEEKEHREISWELYQQEILFRTHIDRCAEMARPVLKLDLRTLLYPSTCRSERFDSTQSPDRPRGSHVALFAVEYALAKVWMEWGIQPNVMSGQGVGEFVAACLAGIFSLEEALKLVAMRERTFSGVSSEEDFMRYIHTLTLQSPDVALILTGTNTRAIEAEVTDHSYWIKRLKHVEYGEGFGRAAHLVPDGLFLCVGPGLSSAHSYSPSYTALPSLYSDTAKDSDIACMMSTLSQLWTMGMKVNWSAFSSLEQRQRLPLPTYPFERQRYWIEPVQKIGRSTMLSQETETKQVSRLHPRPAGLRAYVAPRNDIEQRLATIWRDALGILQIGTHDNFSELGGDSLLCLRIAEKAKQQGLELSPGQIIQSQTIAELAIVVGTMRTSSMQDTQQLVCGPMPFTNDQLWSITSDFEYRYIPLLLTLHKPLDRHYFSQSIHRLLAHHDQLRVRFISIEHHPLAWQQFIPESEEELPFTPIDLGTLSEGVQRIAIKAVAEEVYSKLNVYEGVQLHFVHFTCGEQKPELLLIIIHHAITDGFSNQIILRDLWNIYFQLIRGEQVQLPAKTASFKHFAEKVAVSLKREQEYEQALAYWLSVHRAVPLPVDQPQVSDGMEEIGRTIVALDEEQTEQLKRVSKDNVQFVAILLVALTHAFVQWTNHPCVHIDFVDAARLLYNEIDLSRTVGYIASVKRIVLDFEPGSMLDDTLLAVEEQLDHRHCNDISLRDLCYHYQTNPEIAEKLQRVGHSHICFNYMGRWQQGGSDQSFANSAPEYAELVQTYNMALAQEHKRKGLTENWMSCESVLHQDRIRFIWRYPLHNYNVSTIEALAHSYMQALQETISFFSSSNES